MMVIWIFRITIFAWNYTGFITPCIVSVNVFHSVLVLKFFFFGGIGLTYTVDAISSSGRLSGKQFMISFSCKMELQ